MGLTAALVGCGRMGQCHADVVSRLGIKLIAVADPVESSRTRFLDMWSGTSVEEFKSLRLLLNHIVPDLLLIASTADAHADLAVQAIESGVKMIFLEKPIVTSLRQSNCLLNACSSMGARIAVNHQMRFLPQYTIPKKLLNTDAYGGLQSMNVAAGNFGMAMNGTHYFEAFRFLADESPASVSAWFDSEVLPNPRGPQFLDVSGCVRVTTNSGRRLYIDASCNQGHGVEVTYMARNGRITIDELTGAMTTVVRKPEHRDALTNRYGMPVNIKTSRMPAVELVESTKSVLEALLAGQNYPTIADGTLAIKTLIAAYHSHRSGGVAVSLASLSDDDSEIFPWA